MKRYLLHPMTSLAAWALLVVMLAPAVAHAAPTLERIKARQAIVLAYRVGTPPFSFRDRAGRVRGYSAELCAGIAALIGRQLGLPDLRIEWLPVDADQRIEAVASGKADAECGTTTITLSRMERVDFSLPIFVDGATLAVPARSPVTSVASLGGRRVGVIRGTTTERALQKALEAANVSATLVAVDRPEQGVKAVREGRVDAYAGDRTVLSKILVESQDEATAVLADDFSFEPYGIVVHRDDADFRLAVNRALVTLFRRGDVDTIFQRWLAPIGKPSALVNAMFYLNALPD